MGRWDKDNKPLREIELCMAAPTLVPHEGEEEQVSALVPTVSSSDSGEAILVRGQSRASFSE